MLGWGGGMINGMAGGRILLCVLVLLLSFPPRVPVRTQHMALKMGAPREEGPTCCSHWQGALMELTLWGTVSYPTPRFNQESPPLHPEH